MRYAKLLYITRGLIGTSLSRFSVKDSPMLFIYTKLVIKIVAFSQEAYQ